jgi:NDP-sugar pyrophosphorylase family protein
MTQKVPKSLIELNGEPFVLHQLRLLRANGITRAVLCVGYLGEMVRDLVGDGSFLGVEVEYSFDGPALLGTSGAIRNALGKLGESFFVIYGDSYLPCDYGAVGRAFASSGKAALMTVFRNEGKWDTSNVEFAGGEILAYSKKAHTPRMHYIDYGLGVFRRDAFAEAPPGQAEDLADLYAGLLQRGQLAGFEVHERFYEIGSPVGLKETEAFLEAQRVARK